MSLVSEPSQSCSVRTADAIVTAVNQPITEDQSILRVYVAYKVLLRLGFAVGRIEECLTQGIRETDGWEAAIEWVSRIPLPAPLPALTTDVAPFDRGRVPRPRRIRPSHR
jgi:hypothetical protein